MKTKDFVKVMTEIADQVVGESPEPQPRPASTRRTQIVPSAPRSLEAKLISTSYAESECGCQWKIQEWARPSHYSMTNGELIYAVSRLTTWLDKGDDCILWSHGGVE